VIKHFVILGSPYGNILPLLDPNRAGDSLALFDSRVDATQAAERTVHGGHFGFTVYTTEVPG
jgi:hypothetical protein